MRRSASPRYFYLIADGRRARRMIAFYAASRKAKVLPRRGQCGRSISYHFRRLLIASLCGFIFALFMRSMMMALQNTAMICSSDLLESNSAAQRAMPSTEALYSIIIGFSPSRPRLPQPRLVRFCASAIYMPYARDAWCLNTPALYF